MTLPRRVLIDTNCTPYYHCVSRCVRRAFLCGHDPQTGYDFEHRRAWIESRLHELADIFALDLCAYAVMSNHFHVVLHLNDKQRSWSREDVIERWSHLHRLPEWLPTADECRLAATVELWRERLGSISWFMKCVNEPLARLANKEDGCKGRFWEGRFRSQALLDEEAVIKCMAYVDLNPVRAQTAETPEDSNHTSVQARIEDRPGALAPMHHQSASGFHLPLTLPEYLSVVDWTGRALRDDKRGAIDAALPPIIERLAGQASHGWLQEMRHLTRRYFRAIGTRGSLMHFRDHLGQQRLKGLAG